MASGTGKVVENAENAIIRVLCEKGPLTSSELLGIVCRGGCDKRLMRRLIGELVRRGIIERVPSYEEGRMVFRAGGEACRK